MEIHSKFTNRSGQEVKVYFSESDPLLDLENKILQSIHAFCFCGDKMVLVNHPKSGWVPPGGGIDSGETIEEALIREVKEETNMKVLAHVFIGFQDVSEPERVIRQTRHFCLVEPYGPFISDPDGEITEIKLIDPKDYKHYFDWGVIGERIMQRALELKTTL